MALIVLIARHFTAADDLCQINLSEFKIEPTFANGLADRFGSLGYPFTLVKYGP
jgi:hypothetical protein